MITNEQLADLIFPDVRETIEDLEKRYPKRNLGEKAEVTRFAPSPTGFLHTGSLFASTADLPNAVSVSPKEQAVVSVVAIALRLARGFVEFLQGIGISNFLRFDKNLIF